MGQDLLRRSSIPGDLWFAGRGLRTCGFIRFVWMAALLRRHRGRGYSSRARCRARTMPILWDQASSRRSRGVAANSRGCTAIGCSTATRATNRRAASGTAPSIGIPRPSFVPPMRRDAVTRCSSPASHDCVVAVRGGGPAYPGHSVSKGGRRHIHDSISSHDPGRARHEATRTAGVEAGRVARHFSRSGPGQKYGFIVPPGYEVRSTEWTRPALGGGTAGWRAIGLTMDGLSGQKLITPDGRCEGERAGESRPVSAIRGGGGDSVS